MSVQKINIFHEKFSPIQMQINIFESDTYHIHCTSEHYMITVAINVKYGGMLKKKTEQEKHIAKLFWKEKQSPYNQNGPNTLINDDTVYHTELKHLLSSVIEYIRKTFDFIETLYLEDSGSFDFDMFGQEGSTNSSYYFYYNIALFGETWFEKYFNATYSSDKYNICKSNLFMNSPRLINDTQINWDTFKAIFIMHNDKLNVLQTYFESAQTMREFFRAIRKDYTPIETCKLIGRWITWYLDRTYNDTFTILKYCHINVKTGDSYNVSFILDDK